MLDFLGKVPDVAWAALVTGAVLLLQQLWVDRREDRRRNADAAERERDRAHAAELAAAERVARAAESHEARDQELRLAGDSRQEGRAEAWRDERRQAHAALIALLGECLKRTSTAIPVLADYREMLQPNDGNPIRPLDANVLSELLDALAIVQLVGSDRAQESAEKACELMRHTNTRLWLATFGEDSGGSRTVGQAREDLALCKKAVGAYVQSARLDLGTTG